MSGISPPCTKPVAAKAPEQYADHLRRDIVAMVRVVVRHAAPKFAPLVQNDDSFCPIKTPMMKDLTDLVMALDRWKEQHGLKGAD